MVRVKNLSENKIQRRDGRGLLVACSGTNRHLSVQITCLDRKRPAVDPESEPCVVGKLGPERHAEDSGGGGRSTTPMRRAVSRVGCCTVPLTHFFTTSTSSDVSTQFLC